MDRNFFKQIGQFRRAINGHMPALHEANGFIKELPGYLFPVLQESEINEEPEIYFQKLKRRLEELILPLVPNKEVAKNKSNHFFEKIPEVYEKLIQDARFIYENDPASVSIEEVIICYPGFYAIAIHRFAHELYQLEIPLLPRIFANYAQRRTAIDIHPGAKIKSPFFIDHGIGIVIGETTTIGKQVKIYQGVTLGALSVSKDKAEIKRHPTIKNGVTIYAGSTILGGQTTIGNNSIIGGNVWLTNSVLPHSVVLNKSEKHVKNKVNNQLEPINYSI